jgi:hypothetical protein
VVVEMGQAELPQVMELLTREVALEVLVAELETELAAQAVQALSLFVTPAQFNISLVAQ